MCSPTVSSVSVDRPSHRRVADVGTGPGWIGIVWREGPEPSVSAFDATGKEVAVLGRDDLRYTSRSQHWPFGSAGDCGSPGDSAEERAQVVQLGDKTDLGSSGAFLVPSGLQGSRAGSHRAVGR